MALEHLQAGIPPERAGSDSHDIAGAARIGPLFLLKWREEDGLIEAIRRQTAFTHPRDEVVASAEFFSRVVLAARAGADADFLNPKARRRDPDHIVGRGLQIHAHSLPGATPQGHPPSLHGCPTLSPYPAKVAGSPSNGATGRPGAR